MPIRMTNDENEPEEENSNDKKDSGGGAGILAILAIIGGLIFKYPKVMIPILVIGLGGFICIASFDDSDNSEETETEESSSETKTNKRMSLGAKFDEKKYDATLVYEPLASGYGNTIPESFTLIDYAPRRQSQGSQGSCTGWAISYAARTILQSKLTGENPDDIAFSPAYLFNQNTDSDCDGAYPADMLEGLKKQGNLPLSEFPYNEESCRKKPNTDQKQQAKAFRIEGYQRLTVDGSNYETDIDSVKQYLSQGSPVVISMEVGGTFSELTKATWFPTNKDYSEVKKYKKSNDYGDWGGHAMTAIGYDDNKDGGAVQIMNSWGEDFGKKGIFWLRYEDFNTFVREAYSLYPLAAITKKEVKNLRFGLIENKSEEYIQLTKKDEFTYRTTEPIKKGTRFKVSVENDSPVYVYIFGKESDGSSYVLFPYNEKHSPYCGTKGVRVFPRKQSLEADNIGTRDSIAVVFARENLDYSQLNSQINKSSGKSYGEKIKKALSSKLSEVGELGEGGDFIELSTKEKDLKKLHALVIEFDKI